MTSYTIGKVAKSAGVGVETIRFYEKRGLLERPSPLHGAFRHYPESAAARIRFIKRAQQLGFTLKEIQELLSLCDAPGTDRKSVKELAVRKVSSVRSKIADLQKIEQTLSQLVHDCSGRGTIPGCPIIQAITHCVEREQA